MNNNFSNTEKHPIGNEMFDMVKDLFPICRSITGDGVRETLDYIKTKIPELSMHSIPSGSKVFDWEVPDEWSIRDAYIEDSSGKKIIDFKSNNLHVVGYSVPLDEWMSLEKLDNFLHSLPEKPSAIPYVTSYYKKRWGFCLTHNQRLELKNENYHVVIDSEIKPGLLNYADIVLPGKSKKEVLLSTYICHPSMANNELSGPVVAVALVNWLKNLSDRYYTYRIIFVPETIGSIVYLSKHLEHLKKNVIAGFVLTCLGDDRYYSYLPSRRGNTLSDRVAIHVLNNIDPNYKSYSWLQRGSDERQFCSPGVNLPMATIMRSKYDEYPEYHTSLDDLTLVNPKGLEGGFNALKNALWIIENNHLYKVLMNCEPQLGKRGLYPSLSTGNTWSKVETLMNLISYCDGSMDLLEISETIGEDFHSLLPIVEILTKNLIIKKVSD